MNPLARWIVELAQRRRSPAYYGAWSWGTHPTVNEFINRCVSGDPGVDVYEHLRRRYGHRIRRVLDLGCGSGTILKDFIDRGIGEHYTGVDVSAIGITRARAQLPPDRVDLRIADLNSDRLTGQYDLVMFWYALHHIRNLETVLDNVPPLLGEHGLVFVYDYFGPNRMQWSDAQIHFARSCLARLPLERRRYWANSVAKLVYYVLSGQVVWRPGGFYRTQVRRQPAWLIKLRDPTEAVRSADIYGALCERFAVVEEHVTPGGVAQLILDNMVSNLQDSEGRALVHAILEVEAVATRLGFLPVMHRWMILRNRS